MMTELVIVSIARVLDLEPKGAQQSVLGAALGLRWSINRREKEATYELRLVVRMNI